MEKQQDIFVLVCPIDLVKHALDVLLVVVTELFNKCLTEVQPILDNWTKVYKSSILKKLNKKYAATIEALLHKLFEKVAISNIKTKN